MPKISPFEFVSFVGGLVRKIVSRIRLPMLRANWAVSLSASFITSARLCMTRCRPLMLPFSMSSLKSSRAFFLIFGFFVLFIKTSKMSSGSSDVSLTSRSKREVWVLGLDWSSRKVRINGRSSRIILLSSPFRSFITIEILEESSLGYD